MREWQKVKLSTIITQCQNTEKIFDMENEDDITLSSYGKGAHERIIKDGKYPVPFLGYRVRNGQFIYSRIDARNGAYDIISPELDGYVVSKDFPVYDIDTEKVLPRFLLRSVLSSEFINQVKHSSFGATNRMRIKEDVFGNYTIALPPMEQQQEIVDILDAVLSIIKSRQSELSVLDDLVKARFVEMFGDYEWSTTVGNYIAELRGGKSLAGTEPCKNKVLKTGAATFGWFDPEQYTFLPQDYEPIPEHRVETGDVMISRMNTPDLVGACSYVFEAPEDMYYPDRLWKVIPKKQADPIFIWQLLWNPEIRRQIKEKSGGTSGTMHNISKSKLLDIKCIDVPVNEQNKFADFVKQVNKSKVAIQTALDETKLLFDSLMQEYFG
jgi:type I restriction enzyme S subunit